MEAVSAKFICIVDESKLSSKGLGPNFPLPVEITPFCHEHTRRVIEGLPALKGKQQSLDVFDYVLLCNEWCGRKVRQ